MSLEKLSKADRETKLLEIAISAMKKYAPSYYRNDLIPVIGHEGTISNKSDKDYGRKAYRVDFPFDLTKAIEENREGENVYGGYVAIRGTGEVEYILPTGWWVPFRIPDAEAAVTHSGHTSGGVAGSSGSSSGAGHRIAEPTKVPRNPFKNQ